MYWLQRQSQRYKVLKILDSISVRCLRILCFFCFTFGEIESTEIISYSKPATGWKQTLPYGFRGWRTILYEAGSAPLLLAPLMWFSKTWWYGKGRRWRCSGCSTWLESGDLIRNLDVDQKRSTFEGICTVRHSARTGTLTLNLEVKTGKVKAF